MPELTLLHAGKVRRLYAWPQDRILMVAKIGRAHV